MPAQEEPESLADQATQAVLAANPFVRIPRDQMMKAVTEVVTRSIGDRELRRRKGKTLRSELSAVIRGDSEIEPSRRDRRFTDEAWRGNSAYRR